MLASILCSPFGDCGFCGQLVCYVLLFPSFSPDGRGCEIRFGNLAGHQFQMGSYEKLQASEISVSSPEAHRLICETLERNMDKNTEFDGLYQWLEVQIKLKSGRKILRKILISSKDDLDTLENSLLECDAYAQAIMQLPDAQDIQSLVIEKEYYGSIPVPTEEVWESFVSEYNEMSRGEKILYKRNCLSGIPPEHYDGAIKITVFGEDYTSHYFVLSEYMPKTGKLLKSYMR